MILLLKSNAGYVENAKKQRLSQNDCVRSSPFVMLYKHTHKLLFSLQHRRLGSPFGRAGTP